tara:strand:+ start:2424 stop:2669 length:246 start_codon:yes stop_codon:yes gene_type:complete
LLNRPLSSLSKGIDNRLDIVCFDNNPRVLSAIPVKLFDRYRPVFIRKNVDLLLFLNRYRHTHYSLLKPERLVGRQLGLFCV